MDFYGPLPSGDFLLLLIDRYSRFPEEEVVQSTKASCVIPKLDRIFAVHGIPSVIKTANVPPFNEEEQKRYRSNNALIAMTVIKKLQDMTPLAQTQKIAMSMKKLKNYHH